MFPDEILQEYTLLVLVHNRYVYREIQYGMYGLPQLVIL